MKIKFPILGGRLLKKRNTIGGFPIVLVSNPWREAIEG